MNLAIDTNIMPDVKMTKDISVYMSDLVEKLEITQKILKVNVEQAHKTTKKYYDRSAEPREFDVGQRCWLYDPSNKKGVSAKLKTRWLGPFLIVNRVTNLLYRLRHCETGKELPSLTHVNRMRPYNADRDKFFRRNPDPTRIQRSDETIVPPFIGTDPLTDTPVGLSSDGAQTQSTDVTETQTDAADNQKDTHDVGDSFVRPSTTQGSQIGSQPTASNPDSWHTVVQISKKRRVRGKDEFLIHWEDGTKQWVERSNISPAGLDAFYV
jgi:hypothetical protein